jgi:hypothetical protein
METGGRHQGIASLSKRLERLESHKDIVPDDDLLTKMVTEMKTKEQTEKKMCMKKILDHYKADLNVMHYDVSYDNFVAIVVFTIKYVEQNCAILSRQLCIKLCSEFKKSLAKTFIQSVITECSCPLIDQSIDTIHQLIYPKEPEKKKKGFFK